MKKFRALSFLLLSSVLLFVVTVETKRSRAEMLVSADLSVTKVDSPDPVNVGSNLTYTITVTNNGPDAATNTSWSDTLPPGTTFVSMPDVSGWACTTPDVGTTGTVQCFRSSFPVGSSVFTLTVAVASTLSPGTVLSNTATVTSITPDGNPGNESGTATTTAISPANVFGQKSVSGSMSTGSTITYLVILSNNNTSDQFDNPGNEFTDVLPSDLTLVSADSSSGTATATIATNTVTWNGVVPGNDSITITITATIKNGTDGHTIANQGSINYDADGNGTNESSRLTDDPNVGGASDPTSFVVCPGSRVVSTSADSGAGSLRQAILDVCSGGTITFDMTSGHVTSPILLTGGEIAIGKDVTIVGPTTASLTISGNNNSRIFNVQSGNKLAISNLTIVGGRSSAGGGIFSLGDLTILNTTLTGNNAPAGEGGAIDSEGGTLRIINSTISGNSADTDGGGVLNRGSSTGFITNVTITNNRADADGNSTGDGGGIAQVSSSDLTLNNTIVAGNFKGTSTTANDFFVNVAGGSFIDGSSSNNLIGVDTGLSTDISNGSSGNQIGAGSSIDPLLGALAANGGPTQTHLLRPGSPALNTGGNALATGPDGSLTTDQRGQPRITNITVDIGAVEANYSVTATAGTPQSAAINSTFPAPLQATVKESGTNLSGLSVTFTAPGAGASGTFPGNATTAVAVTTAGGVATSPAFKANGTGGTYNVVASIGTGVPTAPFALTNTAATTTAVSSSVNPSNLGQSVTFTATVTSAAGTPTGTVQFKDGGASIGSPQTLNGSGVATFSTSSLIAGVHTITADYNGDGSFLTSSGTLSGGQQVGSIIRFSSDPYNTTEGSGFTTITVQRIGDLSQAVTVDYSTPDDSSAMTVLPCSTANGTASPRCDFETALGTLRFGAGDGASKTFTVLINQDNFVEGTETLTLTLSNLTGGAGFTTPGATSTTATLRIADDLTEPAGNPIDGTDIFVRQQYRDFLNREPDASGLAFWKDNIDKCNDPARRPAGLTVAQCIEVFRIDTSAAFFLSIEFQNTGYYVERIYKAGFGDISAPTVPVPVRFTNFLRDTQEVGAGVTVGVGSWQTQLDNNKNAFALSFVKRSGFLNRYPALTSATAFVDSLNTNAGGVLSDSERSALISELSTNPADPALRADVLRKIADNALLQQREFNRAFVLMQYFGYLRRNPDAAPEPNLNFDGYNSWLNKLNQFNGDFNKAEMVKAFISSTEYRQRFGP